MNTSKQSSVLQTACIVALIVLALSLSALKGQLYAAGAAREIKIGGTGTALATMRLLAEEFRKKHPDITITVLPSLGSQGGVKALIGGQLDIAISYKEPSGDEQTKRLAVRKYAKTPFVFVTHKTNRVSNITLQEVADIYNGKTLTWPDDTPVRLILRPDGEASTKILEGLSEDMKKAVRNSFKRKGLNIAVTDQENVDLIERLPGSFGAASLCQLISEKRNLNIMSLNSVKPSVRTLTDGSYPYFKDLFMITGPGSSPLARQFIDFVFSSPGRSLLSRTGHLVVR